VVVSCLAGLAVLAAACSTSDPSAEPVEAPAEGDEVADVGEPVAADAEGSSPSWLASQTAKGGRIESTDGEPTRLVLVGVDLHTIMFSDRPDRLTDVVDTGSFIDQWDEMFADSAPNGVLVEHRPSGGTDSLVVVLSRPAFDAAAGTLSYEIEVLADEQHPESVQGLVGEVHDVAPTGFLAASLFIDSIHSNSSTRTSVPPSIAVPPPPPPPQG
jgi:hypothetical protein